MILEWLCKLFHNSGNKKGIDSKKRAIIKREPTHPFFGKISAKKTEEIVPKYVDLEKKSFEKDDMNRSSV